MFRNIQLLVAPLLLVAVVQAAPAQAQPSQLQPDVIAASTSPLAVNVHSGDQSVLITYELDDPTGQGLSQILFRASLTNGRDRLHPPPVVFSGRPSSVSGSYEFVFPQSSTPGTYQIEYIIQSVNRDPFDWRNWFGTLTQSGYTNALVQVSNDYEPPQFSVEQSVKRDCNSYGTEHRRACSYDLVINRAGASWSGALELQIITNLQVNGLFLFVDRTPVSCVAIPIGPGTERATSAGSVISSEYHACALSGVDLSSQTEFALSYLIRADKSHLAGTSEVPRICAVLSSWDGQPSGLGQNDFPAHCIDVIVDP